MTMRDESLYGHARATRERDPEASADWLFDYCYAVTPARYHDVSRHIERFKEHQFGGPVHPVG